MAQRPNIIWIQTDEQRPDSLGCYGSKWAKTPNLDAMAKRGVVMKNCVCQSPVCVPSRSSQLTCLYPQEINVLLNNEVAWCPNIYPEGTTTFPEVFAQAGYETANFGKSHTPEHPTWKCNRRNDGGFDRKYADFCNLGSGYDEEKYHVVKRPGIHRIIIGGSFPVFWDNPTMTLTNDSIDYLRKRNPNKPFFLRVSYNWPHTPVLPPPPFDRLYQTDEIPIQYYDEQAVQKRAAYDRTLAKAQRMDELSKKQYQQQWKDYMGLVAYVDYEIGRLFAAVKALDLEESTIVMFSSDHGRALGEFGHGEKCTFDDQVWRVPLIWLWPGHLPDGEVRDDLCELIDTGKTLLSLANLTDRILPHWRGRDLFGRGPLAAQDQMVFGQIGWPNRNAPILQGESVKKMHQSIIEAMGMPLEQAYPIWGCLRMAIRTQRYRMDIKWMEDGRCIPLSETDGNLFDLQADSKEKNNLWTYPTSQPIIKDLAKKLLTWFEDMDKPTKVFGEPV